MGLDLRTRLLYYNAGGSPLGYIGWSAVYNDSKWTFDGWRTLDHYSVTYIIDGRCRYSEQSGTVRTFSPGDFFFCFPAIPHRIDPLPGEHFSVYWCSFAGPAFDLWNESGVITHENMAVRLEPVEYWLGRFEALFHRLRTEGPGQIVAVASLQSLLAEALTHEERAGVNREDMGWLGQAKTLLDSVERAEELDLVEIARMLNMSYSNFRRKFGALAGMPPGKYHTSKLMERACQWMYEGAITNKEIAQRCGFCNEFHFSERFKQIVGMSPRDFRKSLHNNQAVARNQGR